jgi:ferric-dicitrate binding protein FerR (iron transport regulator)
MDAADGEWKERFAALQRQGKAESCPRAEVLSAWAKGPTPEEGVAHLAECSPCREELVALRRLLAEKAATESPRLALRSRLHAMMPERRVPVLWVAAAAAVVIAVLAFVFSGHEESPAPPRPIVVQPKATPPPAPAPELRPEPPREVVQKPPPPVVPPPAPEKAPPPPLPEPVKEPPVVVKPPPEPEKAAPSPEKAAPALTRARLRGSLLGVSGSVAVQLDADPWQPLRAAQGRDFLGVVKVKTDAAAGKFRAGAHTVYLQRGGELALTLEEGRTYVRLARGEAFFDVTPGRDPFEVETAQGLVRVTGTRFLVALDKNETDVVVQRGAVQFNAIALGAGERSSGGPPQKADLTKRLAWVRGLEDTLRIEAEQMALSGGMAILPDPTASGGRAIGVKDPPKAGQEAVAEIVAKRKQAAPYAVWIRLHWPHGVPPALTLAVGDALTWSSNQVGANQTWQWVRAGSAELPDGAFRIRLTDTQPGMRIDQIVISSDPEFSPEQDKK